jgi:hypothetical protein
MPWRSLVEGPTTAPVENPSFGSFVLASERTQRKDPLDGFKKYTKGWNISDRHYWAVSSPIMSFYLPGLIFTFLSYISDRHCGLW